MPFLVEIERHVIGYALGLILKFGSVGSTDPTGPDPSMVGCGSETSDPVICGSESGCVRSTSVGYSPTFALKRRKMEESIAVGIGNEAYVMRWLGNMFIILLFKFYPKDISTTRREEEREPKRPSYLTIPLLSTLTKSPLIIIPTVKMDCKYESIQNYF
jgi:hypothetical protein